MEPFQYSLVLLEGFLTCPGCKQLYNTTNRVPKLLSCGHTYCDLCLSYAVQSNGGRVLCPIDGVADFRDYEDVAESHHYKDLIEKIFVCCNANYNHIGEFFSPGSYLCACNECKDKPPFNQYRDWVPTRQQDLGGYYGQSTQTVLADTAFRDRVFAANPNVRDRMKKFHTLSAREKQLLYFSVLSVHFGVDYSIPIPGPPPPKYLDENGWVELNRFHNIIPEKYCQNLTDVRKWTISQSHNQIEAVTLKPDKRITLRAIGLCKECGDFTGGYIEYVAIIEGNETTNATQRMLAQNVRYTTRSKQVEKIIFQQPFVMSALREYTIKVKYVGRFLYFGNPARRVDPLKGADGVLFKATDPAFKAGDHQSGQGALTGPIVRLYYDPTVPVKAA